ncbi:fluoride efflux transporter FluC [Janibacter melonis]|uniref:fluoride efflux transporter FluC n=1 Tax=Janibacter melonis TaxID=262209 RepID=UPI002095E324|nr:CrcB family protein [Janibacter melonis]
MSTKGATPAAPAAALPRAEIGAVALGGALGSAGRWLVSLALPGAAGGLAWATLVVNLSGALAMGLLVACLETRRSTHPLVRPFAAVGLLGGWTTYSTLVLDVRTTLADGRAGEALLYVALTLVLGVGAALAGLALGHRWFGGDDAHAGSVVEEDEL